MTQRTPSRTDRRLLALAFISALLVYANGFAGMKTANSPNQCGCHCAPPSNYCDFFGYYPTQWAPWPTDHAFGRTTLAPDEGPIKAPSEVKESAESPADAMPQNDRTTEGTIADPPAFPIPIAPVREDPVLAPPSAKAVSDISPAYVAPAQKVRAVRSCIPSSPSCPPAVVQVQAVSIALPKPVGQIAEPLPFQGTVQEGQIMWRRSSDPPSSHPTAGPTPPAAISDRSAPDTTAVFPMPAAAVPDHTTWHRAPSQ